MTVVNNRSRCVAPMMTGNLSDENSNLHAGSDEPVERENGELYCLETRNGKKVFNKSRHEPSNGKGGGKGKAGKECFRCGRLGRTRADCRAKTHVNGGPPKSAPKGKGAGNYEDEETETSQNVPLETIDFVFFFEAL